MCLNKKKFLGTEHTKSIMNIWGKVKWIMAKIFKINRFPIIPAPLGT